MEAALIEKLLSFGGIGVLAGAAVVLFLKERAERQQTQETLGTYHDRAIKAVQDGTVALNRLADGLARIADRLDKIQHDQQAIREHQIKQDARDGH